MKKGTITYCILLLLIGAGCLIGRFAGGCMAGAAVACLVVYSIGRRQYKKATKYFDQKFENDVRHIIESQSARAEA